MRKDIERGLLELLGSDPTGPGRDGSLYRSLCFCHCWLGPGLGGREGDSRLRIENAGDGTAWSTEPSRL